LEKTCFVNNKLVYYENGQHELQLDSVQIAALSNELLAEAEKLDDQAAELSHVIVPR
jgi:hypothetical protein